MRANRSIPSATVVPVLIYPDVREAVAWLGEAFGLVERVRIGENHRSQLRIGDGAVIVGDVRHERRPPRAGEVTHSVLVRVADANAHCERARSHGARIVMEPTDFEYGERQYTAEDPAGHQWTFSETLADVAPETWGGELVSAGFDGAGLLPQLSVRRGREAVEFYERAFGAVEVYRVGGTDESPDVVAQLTVGKASFWVADESPENANYSPETVGGATVRMLLVVDDPGAAVERAKAAGAREAYPVTDAHGWRLGRVEDPFGHHWEIGRPLLPWPPADGGPDGRH